MMRFSEFLAGVAVGTIGSLVAAAFQQAPLCVLLCGLVTMLGFWVALRLAERFPRLFGKSCSLCATAIVFKDNEVLLVYHPRHKKWLLPGAHLASNQHPHQIAITAVEREAGYTAFFHQWHEPQLEIDRWVTQVPQPWFVLLEKQFAREGHEYHYDLFYIFIVDDSRPPGGGEHDNKWVSVGDLAANSVETYPDIINLVTRAFDFIQREQA